MVPVQTHARDDLEEVEMLKSPGRNMLQSNKTVT